MDGMDLIRSGGGFERVEAVEFEPVFLEGFGEVDELLGGGGFDEVRVGAEGVAAFDVGGFVGGGEDDDDEGFELGLGTYPLEDFVAGFKGEFEVEENNGGKREFFAVGVLAGAGEVVDGFAAVFEDAHGVGDLGGLKGAFHEEDIVLVIVHQQYQLLSCHAFCRRIQNRLPRLGSDSTPTSPFIRWTAFLTMARPIPVPPNFFSG